MTSFTRMSGYAKMHTSWVNTKGPTRSRLLPSEPELLLEALELAQVWHVIQGLERIQER